MSRPISTAVASLVLVLLSSGCSAGGAREGAVSSRLPLSEEQPERETVGALRFRGGLVLRHDDSAFGGLSGLLVSDDGGRFTAVTDRGSLVTGGLAYDAQGRLVSVSDVEIRPLPAPGVDGGPLNLLGADSEALARAPDGGFFVSFERDHRILRFPGQAAEGTPLPVAGPEGLSSLGSNQGLETMAALAGGGMVLIAEGGDADGLHPAWIGMPGDWREFRYRAEPPFRPVDAAALPDGDLLVLERRASWIGGFGSRIARIAAADLAAGGAVAGQEIARLDPPMAVENYEGMDVRADADGRTFIYLVSDDNFSALQRTQMLMFELP